MNKVEYQLTRNDLLQLCLYRSAHLDLNKRIRKRKRLVFPASFLALAIFLCLSRQYVTALLFVIVAVVWFSLSPVLLKRRLRNYYKKYISENCKELLTHPLTVELRPEGMHVSSFAGDSLCHYSAIDSIAKDRSHTYVFIGKDATVVLPHDTIPEDTIEALVTEMEERRKSERELTHSS